MLSGDMQSFFRLLLSIEKSHMSKLGNITILFASKRLDCKLHSLLKCKSSNPNPLGVQKVQLN